MHVEHALGASDGISFEKGGNYGEFLIGGECVHFVLAFRVKASQNVFCGLAFWLAGLSV
jgi:hypothetical protein